MARRRRQAPKPKGYHWSQAKPVVLPCGGRPCRWCMEPVPRGRQSWCGDDNCFFQWAIRTDPALFRRVIFARDHGRCASCRLDCRDFDLKRIDGQIALHAALEWPRHAGERAEIISGLERGTDGVIVALADWLTRRREAVAWHRINKVAMNRSPWEADHIDPIGAGGEWFSLENIQTLCCVCHRAKTNEDSRRIRESKGKRR